MENLKYLEMQAMLLFLETNLQSKEDEFKNLKEPSQHVDLVYKYINKFKSFKDIITEPQELKSNEESQKLRIEGNDYYLRYKNYLDALERYTKSIAFAESSSSYLALGYGNRSAVLFERKYYKECLEDIDRALSLEYPENLKQKLLSRKAKAENLKSQQKPVRYYKDPPIITSKNSLISCAADSIEIQYNAKYGRHIVATKNIEIGDVISAENSFCHVIHQESKYINCHQCLELCYNMIPCKNCTNALYCSEECMSKSYEEYHKYECHFPKGLLSPENVFIRLALIGMEDSKKLEVNQSDNIHTSDSFKEIIKLEMNEEKRDFVKLSGPAISASMAYHSLKENQEFSAKYNSDEDDRNLKRLLYKAYMINNVNSFRIRKILLTQHDEQYKTVATALYGFTSLYNHSCVPNCEFFHYGSLIVMRAQASIKKGEQVTICYGISFSTTPKTVRHAILKQHYFFDCDCKACTYNWPTFGDLQQGKSLPRSFKLKESQNTFDDSLSNKKLMEELLVEGKKIYSSLEKYQPCKNLLTVQDMITDIYTSQTNKDVEF